MKQRLSQTINAREKRARRALARHDYTLIKSRAHNWSVDNQQGYMITDLYNGGLGDGERFDLTLDDVESWIEATEELAEEEVAGKAEYEALKTRVYQKAQAQHLWPTYRDGLGWMLVDGGQNIYCQEHGLAGGLP